MTKRPLSNFSKFGPNLISGFRKMVRNVFFGQSPDFKRLLLTVIFMTAFGAVMVFSSSYVDSVTKGNDIFGEMRSQLGGILIGGLLLIVFANLRSSVLIRLANVTMVLGLVLQVLVVFTGLGTSVNGNRNWISIGGISLQPSEFIKIALILFIAKLLTSPNRFEPHELQYWVFPTLTFGLVAVLVGYFGSDVGTTLIMAVIVFGLYYMAGLPWKFVGLSVLLAAIAIPVVMTSNTSRRGRFNAWLNPSAPDPNGYNWQSEHAKWAFASGGPFGVGLGNSKMKWSWLPEAQNDFIFAIIGEELGMFVALFTIALFLALGVVLMRIARKTEDPFQSLVVYGITFWIMSQAFINISVVLTMFPVLGVNLPLISAGGTSMLATLIAIGIVLGIERTNSLKPSLRVISGGIRR